MSEPFHRPEVKLASCPDDGGELFRQFGETPARWVCGQCGTEVRDEVAADAL